MWTSLLRQLLALMVPCYVANAFPVVMARIIRYRHPLDFGRKFIDGRRVLGDGKSIEGFITGVLLGSLAGWSMSLLGIGSLTESIILSLGTMLGDALGSFVKRRFGLERGSPAPFLDQLAFLLTAILLYRFFIGSINSIIVAILVIITPPIHLVSNFFAYKLGLKDKPW
ncbi:MAG: CDP-2,3-bis-(O-geranylgeranyl)-sn-glycerol synthase [Thermofilaceae archaeon]